MNHCVDASCAWWPMVCHLPAGQCPQVPKTESDSYVIDSADTPATCTDFDCPWWPWVCFQPN